MSSIRARIASLSASVESSDGDVIVSLSNQGGLRVDLAEDVADHHDEQSLGEEIEETVSEALHAYENESAAFLGELRGGAPAPSPDTPAGRRRELVHEAIDTLDVSAKSPRAYVSVDWIGEDGVVVVLRKGALDRLDHTDLTLEINAALFAVSHVRQEKTIAIYKEVFGYDRFAKQNR